MRRYCIFRTDRIGDLVLTLPMAEAIKRHDTEAHVTFCVQDYTRPLAALCPWIDDIISIPDRDLRGGDAAFSAELKHRDVDTAVFAYPRPRLSLAAARARIPRRVGIAYRWYSPFYTHRHREHRKPSVHHESEYNLHLLGALGIEDGNGLLPQLLFSPELQQRADTLLTASGIPQDAPVVVLHPGSGGSARDWPAGNFAALARELTQHNTELHVLVTGTSAEHELMSAVAAGGGDRVHLLAHEAPLDELAASLSRARLVVANSTGPLHVAAAAGAPVLGLYPFNRVIHPRRWSPLGLHTTVLLPPQAAGCSKCTAESCEMHDDMTRISVADVLAAAEKLLSEA